MPRQPNFAPGADEIEAIARATMARLPAVFLRHLDGLVLAVEELADGDTFDALAIEDPFELTGLYQGRPVVARSVDDGATPPDRVTLYRRAILDEWVADGASLEALVAHVVIHEIGHHFGLSDADMLALEAAAA